VSVLHKYGLPLTDSDWAGLPMRVGHFPSLGTIEDLTCANDAVLLWTGGDSNVEISYQDPDGGRHETRFDRESGMIDLLPRGTAITRVRWRNEGPGSGCVSINFSSGSLAQLFDQGAGPQRDDLAARFSLRDSHAADLMARLQAQAVAGNTLGAAYAQGLSLTLVSYIHATYGLRGPSKAARVAGPAQLPRLQSEALLVFIEDFLGRDIGLVDMAAVVGYSPDHFARVFRQTFRMSPYQYLLSRRVERAKVMLRDRSVPIVRVAAACGFSSQSHLNAIFKRHTGSTPGRYRQG
jgi:AraC family transcriptional regulator